MSLLTISGSPHVHSGGSTKKIMYGVILAMVPAMLISFYYFGLSAIILTVVSVASCLLFEWFIQKYILQGKTTITDGSAVITGMLLAFNVPTSLPIWMLVVGALVSIGVAKMSFGGLGKNLFNPAIVGRVFLLISFPVDMTTWPKPTLPFITTEFAVDGLTGPTPLGILKEGLMQGKTISELQTQIPGYLEMMMGQMSGSLGEVSAIAIIIGGLFMLIRKIITWHIPVAFIGTTIVFSGILWMIDPTHYVNPLFHLVTGGLMLAAIFMATDMVTSPMSKSGQLVFGVGCGILTIMIRVWGAYPEGASFAIMLMNGVTPLINKGFKPKKFGEVISHG